MLHGTNRFCHFFSLLCTDVELRTSDGKVMYVCACARCRGCLVSRFLRVASRFLCLQAALSADKNCTTAGPTIGAPDHWALTGTSGAGGSLSTLRTGCSAKAQTRARTQSTMMVCSVFALATGADASTDMRCSKQIKQKLVSCMVVRQGSRIQ